MVHVIVSGAPGTGKTTVAGLRAFSWPAAGGVVEIGYGLAEPYRGSGYATEAVEAMCEWLFAEAGATVITATGIEADNPASRRVLEKLGFTQTSEDQRHVAYRLERETSQ
jgi:ribosomal-protein-alanine N-acetyltransferase